MHAKLTTVSVLVALFLVASSSPAHGSTPRVECEASPCSFALAGGPQTYRFGRGEMRCGGISGRGRFATGTSGVVRLRFRRCRENLTPFRFSCTAAGHPDLPVRTNRMRIQSKGGSGEEPTVVFSYTKVRLACGDIFRAVFHGAWIGSLGRDVCGSSGRSLEMATAIFGHADMGPDGVWDIFTGPRINTYRLDDPWRLAFARGFEVSC